MNRLLDWFAGQVVHWMWATPEGIPMSELDYSDLTRPEGHEVKHKLWKRPLDGRGAMAAVVKPIHEFYHRGSYERHEISERHTPKAVMRFRGKGSKVERRSGKRVKK